MSYYNKDVWTAAHPTQHYHDRRGVLHCPSCVYPQLYNEISPAICRDCVQVWLGVMCSQLGGVADGWLGPRLYHPHHAAIITPSLHFPLGGGHAFTSVLVLYWQSVVVCCILFLCSCSGLISIHVAMTDAGRAVFLCLLWCLLTGSREIVFRLIWKPGPISQGTLQCRSSSKPILIQF